MLKGNLRGTWRPNSRPTLKTSPDCLVFLNGELALPSGASPFRRVDIQPLITSVSVSASISSPPATADIQLHIPRHYLSDLYRGGNLILTSMMEVSIYMKGHFLVNGAPQYYPVFWGVTTNISQSLSSGENTVGISCQDMLYWWEVQTVNINPSILARDRNQASNFTVEGNVFTGMNAFQIMYHLSRQVHGDSLAANQFIEGFQTQSTLNETENLQLMAYWTKRWGKITTALRMYGPTGTLLPQDPDALILKRNYFNSSQGGKRGTAGRIEANKYDPDFYDFFQGNIDLSLIPPFHRQLAKIGSSVQVYTSELQTKMQIARQVAEIVGYEFYQDVTGEFIFKPPFYNLDVIPNGPISVIDELHLIQASLSEIPPEVTALEGTGAYIQSLDVGMASEAIPRAKYIDYKLVQKFGYKPGTFSSEYIGSQVGGGGSQALFYHLVDQMDRQNARAMSGSATIPLRPELRLGYPVFFPSADAYYYVDQISHSFQYGGSCTTQLSLYARRGKYYGDFDWQEGEQAPKPGSYADPDNVVRNLYLRPKDPLTGTPVGDRNVILVLNEARKDRSSAVPEGQKISTNKIEEVEEITQDVLSLRASFNVRTSDAYMLQIDPALDNPTQPSPYLPVTANGTSFVVELSPLKRDPKKILRATDSFVFPVSDERGYEVFGGYQYGRTVSVQNTGLSLAATQEDKTSTSILYMAPAVTVGGQNTPNIDTSTLVSPLLFNRKQDPKTSYTTQLSPTNIGRSLFELTPNLGLLPDYATDQDRSVLGLTVSKETTLLETGAPAKTKLAKTTKQGRFPGVSRKSVQGPAPISKQFDPNARMTTSSRVSKWRPLIERIRQEEGITAEQISTEEVLAFITVESGGNENSFNGKSHYGLLQSNQGNLNFARQKNPQGLPEKSTELRGDPEASLRLFFRTQKAFAFRTGYNSDQMAVLWKGGAGTHKNVYIPAVRTGQTEDTLLNTLNTAPNAPNTGDYVLRHRDALSKWGGQVDTPASTETFAPSTSKVAVLDPPLDTEERTSADLRPDTQGNNPRRLSTDREEALTRLEALEREQERDSFSQGLQQTSANQAALPAHIKAPRDPNLLPLITEYLEGIYQTAFGEIAEQERLLSGQDRNKVTVSVAPNQTLGTLSGEDAQRDAKLRAEQALALLRATPNNEG